MFNNHFIANFLQSVPVNFFTAEWFCEDVDKSFYGSRCIVLQLWTMGTVKESPITVRLRPHQWSCHYDMKAVLIIQAKYSRRSGTTFLKSQ